MAGTSTGAGVVELSKRLGAEARAAREAVAPLRSRRAFADRTEAMARGVRLERAI